MSRLTSRLILSTLLFLPISLSAYQGTYYSDSLVGNRTISGDVLRQDAYSAAVCDAPVNSLLYVSRGGTGVVVKANDRPNCQKYPNLLDLTTAGFQLFAPTRIGSIDLSGSILLDSFSGRYSKRLLETNFFDKDGISLESGLPNTFTKGETIRLAGWVTDGKDGALIRVEKDGKEVLSDLKLVGKNRYFEYFFTIAGTGEYRLYLMSMNHSGGQYFVRATEPLWILDESQLSYPTLPIASRMIENTPVGVSKGGIFGIGNDSRLFSEYTLSQDRINLTANGTSFATFSDTSRLQWGTATLSTRSFLLSTPFSIDRSQILPTKSQTVIIDRKYPVENEVGARVAKLRKSIIVQFRITDGAKVRKEWFVTTPDGGVRKYSIDARYLGSDGYIRPNTRIQISVPTLKSGTYLIETVRDSGLAYFNIPISVGTVWNLIEPITPEIQTNIRKNLKLIRTSAISSLNKLRAGQDLGLLSEDDDFTRVAQAKADDMATRDYLGHRDPDGKYIGARLSEAGVQYSIVGENVAGGSMISGQDGSQSPISDLVLVDGLELSGSHRMNMLMPEATRVGIGYAIANGKTYFVEIIGK